MWACPLFKAETPWPTPTCISADPFSFEKLYQNSTIFLINVGYLFCMKQIKGKVVDFM